jgi:hypothetical protein
MKKDSLQARLESMEQIKPSVSLESVKPSLKESMHFMARAYRGDVVQVPQIKSYTEKTLRDLLLDSKRESITNDAFELMAKEVMIDTLKEAGVQEIKRTSRDDMVYFHFNDASILLYLVHGSMRIKIEKNTTLEHFNTHDEYGHSTKRKERGTIFDYLDCLPMDHSDTRKIDHIYLNEESPVAVKVLKSLQLVAPEQSGMFDELLKQKRPDVVKEKHIRKAMSDENLDVDHVTSGRERYHLLRWIAGFGVESNHYSSEKIMCSIGTDGKIYTIERDDNTAMQSVKVNVHTPASKFRDKSYWLEQPNPVFGYGRSDAFYELGDKMPEHVFGEILDSIPDTHKMDGIKKQVEEDRHFSSYRLPESSFSRRHYDEAEEFKASVGGAIGGALLLGPFGMVLGAGIARNNYRDTHHG